MPETLARISPFLPVESRHPREQESPDPRTPGDERRDPLGEMLYHNLALASRGPSQRPNLDVLS